MWASLEPCPIQLSLFEMTNYKFLVSSQARNNFEPYDEEKSVTENWDSNPIIAYPLGCSIPGWVVTHKETCDGHQSWWFIEGRANDYNNGRGVKDEKRSDKESHRSRETAGVYVMVCHVCVSMCEYVQLGRRLLSSQ